MKLKAVKRRFRGIVSVVLSLGLILGDPFISNVFASVSARDSITYKSSISALPVVTGSPAGFIAADFKVTELGSANYTIPIKVLPGTGGMEPKISVTYDSHSGNGILGMGWSLNGLSLIVRCPANKALHGFIDPVDFDSNDKFCLDGQMLVGVSGAYGANLSEYKTESETFSKIISYGSVGSGPTTFKIWTKNGLIYEYGFAEDSRVQAQGRTDVLIWRVNKIEDTTGNYMTFEYAENSSTGESYPIKINYTANDGGVPLLPYNSVEFVYQARTDVQKAYVSGSVMTT